MKPVLLLLLAAAVGCSADFITIRSQPMPQGSGSQGPRLYVVNSQNEEAAPRVMGLLSRLQLQPSAGAVQDLASQPFSTILSGGATSFFDTSLSKWMDQHMAALDQLQAQLGPPPVLSSGCPRLAAMRAAAAAGAASLSQDALSYLAASRFGPGLLSSFPQQGQDSPFDADWQLTGADVGEEDAFADEDDDVDNDDDDGDDDDEELTFDAGGMGEYWVTAGGQALGGSEQQPMMLTASGLGLAGPAGRGFMPSMLSEDDSMAGAAFYPATGVPETEEEDDDDDNDGPTWFFVFQDGSVNWGFICFLALALAVVPLWACIIRALVHLFAGVPSSSGSCPRCPFARFKAARQQAQQEQFMMAAKAPLLAEYLVPLAPEKPVAEKAAPEILTSIEVASEQTPRGDYVVPSNNQFVTVRYVPLKGEEV